MLSGAKMKRILLLLSASLMVAVESAAVTTASPASPASRPGCQASAAVPTTRINTSQRLAKLRDAMSSPKLVKGIPLKAYIVPSDDEHQSEYVSAYDKRREYISGFSGSAGTAVVTTRQAALWTDGRYFLQAELQLDCNWILMKSGNENVPGITEWLQEVLEPGDRVGADPRLVGAATWLEWKNELSESGITLDPVSTNLIDVFWNQSNGRPKVKSDPAYVHNITYAGKSWQSKVAAVRAELNETEMDAMVVTALDEVAWLLNIRGSDIATSPLVKSYVYLSQTQVILFISEIKVTGELRRHLNSDRCGQEPCVEIRRYDHIFIDLPRLVAQSSVLVPSKYSYSNGASFAIHDLVPEIKRHTGASPILLLKAVKNAVEVEGMKNSHIRDSVALCDFLSQLEEEVSKGETWDELKVVNVLADYRKQQALNKGVSFRTIAGFGPNGAVIHYEPKPETNRIINNSSLLLLDSGGQYLDGTTDVTRTLHFGQPTTEQKELYTRVLMGAIDLAALVIPDTIEDTQIDVVARSHLYSVGLDYRHGTGHGIGAFLGVHESPTQIKIFKKNGHLFEENYFFSDEPGYYRDNEFGIRLETILRVVHKDFNTESSVKFFAFEPITLVPFEPKLIVPEMMTSKQIQWLNFYNALIRTRVGEEMKRQNRMRGFYWIMSKTGHISHPCSTQNSAPINCPSTAFLSVLSILILRFYYYV